MSADELRKAAATLRERAADATPAPWNAVPGAFGNPYEYGPDHMRVVQGQHEDASTSLAVLKYSQHGESDALYIATMHPGVGLALADWLDDEAKAAGYHESRVIPFALTIARLIIGGQA